MVNNLDFIWFALRERRTSLQEVTKLHESSSRRKGFAAAMRQFEEQMTAAKVVTAATRPLNLYYALVQAGHAIQAAHAPNPWNFSRHGLTLDNTKSELPTIIVRPDTEGAFQAVARTTGSPGLDTGVTLGALWASLPDLAPVVPLKDNPAPHAFRVHAPSAPFRPFSIFGSGPMPPIGTIYVNEPTPVTDEDKHNWLQGVLKDYPGAAGIVFRNSTEDAFESSGKSNHLVNMKWPHPHPERELTDEELDNFLNERVPEYLHRAERYLRPSLSDGQAPPSPLITWWLLLYSFSMYARYRPAEWIDLLDTDKSKHAVALEFALHAALDVIPHLVLEALDKEPILLAMR